MHYIWYVTRILTIIIFFAGKQVHLFGSPQTTNIKEETQAESILFDYVEGDHPLLISHPRSSIIPFGKMMSQASQLLCHDWGLNWYRHDQALVVWVMMEMTEACIPNIRSEYRKWWG